MTHDDAGKYSAKHPPGTVCNPAIAAAVRKNADNNSRIPCAVAHELAAELKVPPSEIGKTIDLLECRIVQCQLGLFGYSPEKKAVKAAGAVADNLRLRLQRQAAGGIISCAACWDTAHLLGLTKMAVAAACESLGIKIKPCQLGAF